MTQLNLYPAEVIRAIDRRYASEYDTSGLRLMKKAARSVLTFIEAEVRHKTRAQVFCGSGNNAGDGYFIAALLADRGWAVEVFVIGDPLKLGPDAAAALRVCEESSASMPTFRGALDASALIIDALLGLGVKGSVRPIYQSVIQAINAANATVIALDLPSGLDPDTGIADAYCVRASTTITFIARKIGLYSQDGSDVSGEVILDDLGVPKALMKQFESTAVSTLMAKPLLPRQKRSHKGRFGRVLIVGGNLGMGGACLLAAEAALRSGAGLVMAATHIEHTAGFLAGCPEVMVQGVTDETDVTALMDASSAIVLGPGLGQDAWALNLFHQVMQSRKPLVIDADALNLVSQFGIEREDLVMTPHPLEAARLLGKREVDEDRLSALKALTDRYQGVMVLKGHATLVGDGARTVLNRYGNPGMATAGMGDVLAGIIGSLLAQGLSSWDAATQGVAHHGAAADIAVLEQGEVGLLASDVVAEVGKSLAGLH